MRLWTWIAARVPPGSAILDIGAFRGAYALAAKIANPAAFVYAFEPNPETVGILRRACAQSGVEVVEVAVAEQNGLLPFFYDSARSRLAESGDSADPRQQLHHVPAVTLDAWGSGKRVIPTLIKIDVEGAETQVLRGAVRVLHECQPIILCEVLTDSAGDAVEGALPSRYRFYYVDENDGMREEPRITRRYWRNKNWLLVPRHRQSELAGLLPLA
jgi:FkbM family methyltransferase